jgi:flagellar hook assembly protein FlgD
VDNDQEIEAADFQIEMLKDDLADAHVEVVELGAETSNLIPATFTLEQNYPNPFNPTTKITYGIPAIQGKTVAVKLSIYNVSGQIMLVLVDEEKSAGTYEIEWDGKGRAGVQVPSGAYFYNLEAGDFRQTMKMLLVK